MCFKCNVNVIYHSYIIEKRILKFNLSRFSCFVMLNFHLDGLLNFFNSVGK